MTMRGTLDPAELLKLAIRQAQSRVHTSMPGEVLKVHTSGGRNGQWVDVRPLLRVAVPTEDGGTTTEDLPDLPMVPVAVMRGGGFFVSVPLQPGDQVTILFAERSLDQWVQKSSPGSGQPVSPGHGELHGLSGAQVLPCPPASVGGALGDVHPDDLVIGRDSTAGGAQAVLRLRPDGSVQLDAPQGLQVNGDVTVSGTVDATDEITAKSGTGQDVTMTGHTHNGPLGTVSPANPGT